MSKKKVNNTKKIILFISAILFLIATTITFILYQRFLSPNVTANQDYLYIPTGSSFEELMENLGENEIVKDTSKFRWAAERKGYPLRVKAGKYKLIEGMNNRTLVNLLSAGLQEP